MMLVSTPQNVRPKLPSYSSPRLTKSQQLNDIGPGSRPHTAALLTRRRVAIMGRKVSPSKKSALSSPGDRDNYEFLEYEWPDLPPIDQIKDAISRNRVCRGMSYILPVDKSKNSIENVYRTDLRFMFRDPYRNELVKYNEQKIQSSAKQHFVPNSPAIRYVHNPDDYTRYILNADCEKIRRLYAQTAPPKGLLGKNTTPNSPELRTRSSLYLPLKTKIPAEAIKMKEEANKILRSVQEKAEEDYEGCTKPEGQPVIRVSHASPTRTRGSDHERKVSFMTQAPQHGPQSGPQAGPQAAKQATPLTKKSNQSGCCPIIKKTDAYKSYDDLVGSKIAANPQLPDLFKSPYLSEQKNQEIWVWLTKEDTFTDFNHFLNVCS